MADFFSTYEDELKKKTPSQIAGEQVKKTYKDSFTPYESKIVRTTPFAPEPTAAPAATQPAQSGNNWFQSAVNALKGAGDAIKSVAEKLIPQLGPQNQPAAPVTPTVTPGASNAPIQPISPAIQKMPLDLGTQSVADISAQLQPNIIQSMTKDIKPEAKTAQPTNQPVSVTGGQTYLSAAPKPTVWDKITNWFNDVTGNDATTQKALAQNAYALAKSDSAQKAIEKRLGVKAKNPDGTINWQVVSELAKPGGNIISNSPMEDISKDIGIRGMPTNSEFTQLMMIGTLGLGLAEAPLVVLKGLGIFTAVDTVKSQLIKTLSGGKATRVSELVAVENPTIKNVIDIAEFLAMGAATHKIFTKSPAVFDKLTKDVITKYNLPETVVFDSKDLRGMGNKSTNDLLSSLKVSGEDIKNIRKASVQGTNVQVEVQSADVTKVVDKPYWSKVKKILHLPETAKEIVGPEGKVVKVTPVAGLLGNGETVMTPEAIRTQVEGTNLGGTPAGKDFLKLAQDAETAGKNVKLTVIGVKTAPAGAKPDLKIIGNTITTINEQGAEITMNAGLVDKSEITLINQEGATTQPIEAPVTQPVAGTEQQPAGPISEIAAEIKPLGEEMTVYRGAADQTIDVTRKMGITNGVSFSTDKTVAQRFADKNAGTVREYTISPDAKVVDLSILEKAVADVPIDQKNEAVTKIIADNQIDAVRTDIKAGAQGEGEIVITNPKVLLENNQPTKTQEFNVGDVLDPQGNTNMAGNVTIREISGNTLKFVDSKGTEYSGMQRSIVRDLVKGGSWKKVSLTTSKELQPLMDEAKKYPSAEEFRKAVGDWEKDQDWEDIFQFHGTQKGEPLTKAIADGTVNVSKDALMGSGFYVTGSEEAARMFGRQVSVGTHREGVKTEPTIVAIDMRDLKIKRQDFGKQEYYDFLNTHNLSGDQYNNQLKKEGYDALNLTGRGETVIFDPKKIKEFSFEDFYNKVVEKTPPLPSPTGEGINPQVQKVPEKPVGESGGPGKLTLAPSKATTSEEVVAEAAVAGVPGTIREGWIQGTNRREIKGYNKALITKQDIKTLITNSDEFSDNPVLTVNQEGNLSFIGKKIKFTMKPEALGLNPERINPGDKIRVDEELLKEKGAPMQMRVYKDNKVLGFNPKNLEEPLSAKADGEMEKIVKQSEIAKALSDKLGVPIRRGKFRAGGAIGIYKTAQKIVRIKSGGLNTVFHEVAHYLDDTIGFSKDIDIDERKALMAEYGYSYAGQPNKQRMEAFAEFIRFRLTGQVVKALEMAPEFSKVFEGKIVAMPDVKSVLDTAAADYARWQAQPAAAKILSQLSIGGQKKGPLKDRVVNTLHDVYTLALDDLHPLSEFSGLGKRLFGPLPAIEDPYVLARNLRGWVGKADLFLNEGTFGKTFWKANEKGKTVMDFKGPGYSQIMKPIADAHKLDEFRVYIVAQRVINDLAPRSIKTGISLADAKLAVEELSAKNPEFEKVSIARRQFNDQLLDFAKENGLLGEEGLKKIKELNKFYTPFFRVMEETGAKFLGKSKIAGNLPSPIKKIRGSEREIIDPLESDVKNVYAIINAAERNNIGVAMANLAAKNFELGRLFEEVAKPMKPVTVNAKEVLDKVMKESLGDFAGEMPEFPEELADLTVTLFRPTQAAGPNMLNVNLGDVKKVYQVDPDLFKAIQGLNLEDAGIIMRILSAPAKWLRAGATLSPDFSVRNPLRDQFTAFTYSKYGFIPGVDLVRGMFELFNKGDVYKLWKAGGGEHSMFVSLDREVLQKSLKEVLKQNGAPALAYIKNPIKILQIISEFGEAGTRLGEMRRGLASGGNPIEVAFASRNVTLDFGRIGAWGKGMNMITAFWNANVQGTDMMIRAFKNRPFNTLFKVLLGITLPSILLYMANRKDKRWKEIPSWQKDLFWIILTKDHIYRIPKPFELGILFGSVPERIMEYMDSKDPELFDQLGADIATGFSPGFIPTGLIPIIENITNYSFFLDRPIVGQAQQGLPPAQQAGNYTSETAKIVGQALNYSPAKIDNMIFGYSGGLGKYAVAGIDKILTGTKIATPPTPPASSLEDQPVIKAYMIRNPIGSGSESVNRVYNLYSSANAELTYVKKLAESGQRDKAIQYVKDHPEVVNAPALSTLVTIYSQINKASTQVRNSADLTPEQKKTKINQLDQMQTDLAAQMLENIKKQKKNE